MNQIICQDNLSFTKSLNDNYIDLIVTSCPYDQLRKYNGFDWDFEGLVKELYKKIKEGGIIVWVVADSTMKRSESGTSFKQALYFKEQGFNLHDTMIYAKNNWVPLTHNRYEQQFEYMFVFSKGKPKTFNPILIPTKTSGITKMHETKKEESAYVGELGSAYRKGSERDWIHKDTKLKPNIWFYSTGSCPLTKFKTKHPAPFPEELVRDHIITWTNEGDLVYDPFNGSGTTTAIAKLMKRNYIGVDISQEYCKQAEERLKLV